MNISDITDAIRDFSETPSLDARILMHTNPNIQQITDFIHRRKMGEPVAKILGQKGFWKRDFHVNRHVLDPRPDSETMIEAMLKVYPDPKATLRILDIGTGSGCLLISVLDEYPSSIGIGIDKSSDALEVAHQNAVNTSAQFALGDLFIPGMGGDFGMFDVILSNPPYIPTSDIEKLDPAARIYDPLLALDGGKDGLDAYRAIAKNTPDLLNPNGVLFLEIGAGQESDVITIMTAAGWQHRGTQTDTGGIPRILILKR